jgi:hypothetical protein
MLFSTIQLINRDMRYISYFILLTAGLLFAGASAAPAAIIIDADDVFTTSDPSVSTFGSVDVFVTYDGIPAGVVVSAYNFQLNLPSSASGKIKFVNAVLTSPTTSSAQPTARSPLFAGQNPFNFTSTTNFADDTILVADNLPGMNQSTALINNRALATIRYEVLPGATGTFSLSFEAANTYLFDGNNAALTLSSLQPGSITINAIPEPSTVCLGTIFIGLLCYRKVKRTRSR